MHLSYIENYELSDKNEKNDQEARINELKVPEGYKVLDSEETKLDKLTQQNKRT